MTLILALTTPDCVIQVSDMRLTRAGQVVDDDSGKAILVCGHFVFGYTGIAEIGGERTNRVLAGAFADDGRIRERLARVKAELERRLSGRPGEQLVVVGVGWVRQSAESELVPGWFVLSNLEGDDWRKPPRPEFALGATFPGPTPSLVAAGQRLTAQENNELRRVLRRRVKRGGHPGELAVLMAQAVRAVASRNTLVGSSLLISSIPRRAVPAPMEVQFGLPDWRGRAEFRYAPGGPDEARIRAPDTACNGIATADAFVAVGDEAEALWNRRGTPALR